MGLGILACKQRVPLNRVDVNGVDSALLSCLLQGYYRRASANMALGKFRKALTDFEAVKKVGLES